MALWATFPPICGSTSPLRGLFINIPPSCVKSELRPRRPSKPHARENTGMTPVNPRTTSDRRPRALGGTVPFWNRPSPNFLMPTRASAMCRSIISAIEHSRQVNVVMAVAPSGAWIEFSWHTVQKSRRGVSITAAVAATGCSSERNFAPRSGGACGALITTAPRFGVLRTRGLLPELLLPQRWPMGPTCA